MSSPLHLLADAVGIIPEYVDMTGITRQATDESRVLLLAAMGIDASSDEAAGAALERLRAEERARVIEPARVAVEGSAAARALEVQVPEATARPLRWTLEVREEAGGVHRAEGVLPQGAGWRATLELPALPPGYHDVRLALEGQGATAAAAQRLIVVPPSCLRADDLLGGRPAWGLTANLYSARRDGDWGVGDFRTLAMLLEWTAERGGDFVGVNPLHALRNRDADVSPYSPVSRIFRNPLYIDVAAAPGWRDSHAARAWWERDETRDLLDRLRDAERVDYARVWAVKREALALLHRDFPDLVHDALLEEYRAWCEARGEALTDYATFAAIQETQTLGPDWRTWPDELREAHGAGVRAWRAAHDREVDFHRWMQWVADRQLREVQAHGRAARMAVGLYQDLAIGSSAAGSDAWAWPDLFLAGVNVGAPPDPYSAVGQDWGLPPIDPRRLRASGYDYFIRLVRGAFANAGALRIDHVMGLFRLFWIPWGRTGKEGAYVRYPSEDLLGILALESQRHGAIVVGEDLGTVPDDVPPALERWGILSSSVMTFLRGDGGTFLASDRYPRRALATANTHDMPPLEAFWSGADIPLRVELGLSEPGEEPQLREERERDKRHLLERLRAEGLAEPGDDGAAGGIALRAAVHAFMTKTPSALVGLSLDDLAGEDRPVNIPGVGPDKFPSWTRRMRMTVEEMRGSGAVEAVMRVEGRGKGEEGGT